MAIKNSEFWDL